MVKVHENKITAQIKTTDGIDARELVLKKLMEIPGMTEGNAGKVADSLLGNYMFINMFKTNKST